MNYINVARKKNKPKQNKTLSLVENSVSLFFKKSQLEIKQTALWTNLSEHHTLRYLILAFLCKLLPSVCLPERVARNRKCRRNDLSPSRFLMLVTRSK